MTVVSNINAESFSDYTVPQRTSLVEKETDYGS